MGPGSLLRICSPTRRDPTVYRAWILDLKSETTKLLFFKKIFIYLFYFHLWLCWIFVSVRGLFLVAASGGPLFIAVRGSLTITASLVVEHRLQTRRLSNCGSRAQLLGGMWDPTRPGLEPVSPALAGRLSTIAAPGKPQQNYFLASTEHGLPFG